MEAKSFIKLLRKVIREEVKTAVKQVLNEQQTTNHKKVIDHGINLSEIADKPNPYETKATEKRTFTKNPVLNDLLNETAATPPSQELTDWSAMNFKSEMAQSFGADRQPGYQTPLATKDINGAPVNMANENVAKTVNLMTKDYSALMKAIDKKKGK